MATKLCAYTRFNLPPYQVTTSGSAYRVDYAEGLDEHGIRIVKESGKSDFDGYIQSFKDDCDIYKIIDRLTIAEKSPDVVIEALSQFRPDMFRPGKFGDFTNLPKNIHEVAQFYSDSVDFFNNLPVDVRQKYHYSVDEFFADFDNFVKSYISNSVEQVSNSDVQVSNSDVQESDSNE